MTIEHLYKTEQISVRAYNVCQNNKFKELEELLNFYNTYGNFEKLRNCGNKTDIELINVCKKYKLEVDPENTYYDESLSIIINRFNRVKRELANNYINNLIQNLSIRSKNGLTHYLNNDFTIKNLNEKLFLNGNYDLNKIQNIGTKSLNELISFKNNLKLFLIELNKTDDEIKLISNKNRLLLNTFFPNFQLENNHSIFKVIQSLLDSNNLFTEKQTLIYKTGCSLLNNISYLKNDEIAKILDFSKERVRQIKDIFPNILEERLSFLTEIEESLFDKYEIEINTDLIELSTKSIDLINQINETTLTKHFATYILYSHLKRQFNLIGNIEDVFNNSQIRNRNRYNWKNIYLIKKELTEVFNFNNFIEDINKRLNENIENSYCFNFKSYTSQFLIKEDYNLLLVLLPILEKIIYSEFGLFINQEYDIEFFRNTYKSITEHVIDILEDIKQPLALNKIQEELEVRKILSVRNISSLRASCLRSDEIVAIGRTSTYGLKKWELELSSFKGGTIRDITESYLNNFCDPQHITQITKEVLKYRPNTYERSILDNIKADETSRFRLFKNSYIGLTSKSYSKAFIPLKNKNNIQECTWHDYYNQVLYFLRTTNKMPKNKGTSEEKRLFRWIREQSYLKAKGELESNELLLINQLLNEII